MTWEQEITVEGKVFQVTISDDHEALRSAFAEGRAIVGLWDGQRADQNLAPAAYVVEAPEDIDAGLLERVVRRKEGLPWNIARTKRLLIREFVPHDFAAMPVESEAGMPEALFLKKESLTAYIRHQYGFYEYGIWALVDHSTGRLVGRAGICNLDLDGQEEFLEAAKNNDTPVELGYHIFSPYRRNGYGKEACRAILSYGAAAVSERIYARIHEGNHASIKLAEGLGFRFIARTHSGSDPGMCLYEWNCS
ncbi:GNAT family N-acetyltransferase [Lacrimispora indolis]|uniref:GNAT family N-acetyltransferase n=1 Tax=Lacrimispora indolis TaxID=69825 RepID=UPI00045EA8EC|nr:GNAT family N-acetyltransferase [Lacrimispora indolis]